MRAIITGANAGIGREAAVQLAAQGWEVVMACDMSSQQSIRTFTDACARRFDALDVLVNNAAHFDMSQKERRLSAEGQEIVWATNHLGPFLLSMSLAPLLARSARGGRILNVSSNGLLLYPFLRLGRDDPSLARWKFSMQRSYYHSKLAVMISTIDLAERFAPKGITVNRVRVTAVRADLSRYPDISDFQKRLYAIKSRKSIEPSEMAETYTYLCTSDEVKTWTGKHVDEHRKVLNYRPYELRKDVQQALYDLSMRSVGLGA